MSETVKVNLGDRSYNISIGRNLPVGTSLKSEQNVKAMIVSDSSVTPFYGLKCQKALQAQGIESTITPVPAGEASKNIQCAAMLYEKALECGLDRGSIIVALGGGMVGDLAGFVAATFLRGIRFIQVPTTLLAMVDSSVGGKTGVNLPKGKNLIGAFHQPIEVVADLDTLSTLPAREYISGLAEVVKYGVIWDRTFFEKIENNIQNILDRHPDILEQIIKRCCEIKAEIVAMDEKELGVRAILNFGHTIGHCVESLSGYGKYLHGEAVAIGMAYAGKLSVSEKNFAPDDCNRMIHLLSGLGLPTSIKENKPDWNNLNSTMLKDKKGRNNKPKFVLAEKLGSVLFGCEIPTETIKHLWLEEKCNQ